MTAWIAAPLLFIGVLFGVLLFSGTTVREVPSTLRAMFGAHGFPGRRALRRRVRRRGAGGDEAPYDNYPLEDDAPTIPEPPAAHEPAFDVKPSRRRAKKPARDFAGLDRVVEGPYTLPSLDLLNRQVIRRSAAARATTT